MPPDEFVPLAEQSGLILQLTERVLEMALAQSARWALLGLEPVVAVNVSVRDLHREHFAADVAAALLRHDVPAARVVLEITESGLMADPVRAAATLRELDDLGVTLSLDDFGTGYSSLAHLRTLPVREVKIDKSFVLGMGADADDARIVRTIIELGSALGLRVVAEGVQDVECWNRLVDLGCDQAQGMLLAPPMPAAQVTDWLLESGRRLPSGPAARPRVPDPRSVRTTRG